MTLQQLTSNNAFTVCVFTLQEVHVKRTNNNKKEQNEKKPNKMKKKIGAKTTKDGEKRRMKKFQHQAEHQAYISIYIYYTQTHMMEKNSKENVYGKEK